MKGMVDSEAYDDLCKKTTLKDQKIDLLMNELQSLNLETNELQNMTHAKA